MKKATSESDPYLPMIRRHWDAVTGMYVAFEERAPMIEFDVASGQIRARPAKEYIDGLTDRTREKTRKLYKKTVAEGGLMVFVRDESKEVLRSYVFPAEKGSPTLARDKKGRASASS